MVLDLVSTRERPSEADDRSVPRHREGAILSGSRNSHGATLVERSTRQLLVRQLDGKDANSVAAAITDAIKALPKHLRRCLTWDGGQKRRRTRTSPSPPTWVYFCDPETPLQRGTNENTNGVLRQYFPIGPNLRDLPQADLDDIARKMINRSRKTLGYRTPAAMLAEAVAATIG